MIDYSWRGQFTNLELNVLHAEGFGHRLLDDDWQAQVSRHSLGWVCAREGSQLVGFVNVGWDGGVHAFLLDTLAAARVRRGGVGTRLVAVASDGARAAGCEWLHVDFEDHLRSFYFGSCGFNPTNAGLIALKHASPDEETTISLVVIPATTAVTEGACRLAAARQAWRGSSGWGLLG